MILRGVSRLLNASYRSHLYREHCSSEDTRILASTDFLIDRYGLGNCALFLYRDVASKLLVRLADLAQVSTSHILCSNLALTNVEPYFPDN